MSKSYLTRVVSQSFMPVLEEITVNCAAAAGDSAVDTSTAESYDLREKHQKDRKEAKKAKGEAKGKKAETKTRDKGDAKAEETTKETTKDTLKDQPKEKSDSKSHPKPQRKEKQEGKPKQESKPKQEGKPKRKEVVAKQPGDESAAKTPSGKKRKGKTAQKPKAGSEILRTKPIVSNLNANAPAFCPWNLKLKESQRLPEEDKDVDWEKDFRRVNFTRRYSVCDERSNPNATEATRNATKETANTRRHRNINRNNVQQGDMSAMEQLIQDLELDQSQLLSIRISRRAERPTNRHADHDGRAHALHDRVCEGKLQEHQHAVSVS